MTGYSIAVVVWSWGLGRWDVRGKTLWALGTLRFGVHRNLSGPYGGGRRSRSVSDVQVSSGVSSQES